MPKINSFIILSLNMQGFKCFKDETEYEFGNITFVKGANSLGKSSIADAISFAFTGTSFFNEKGLDRLHNPESPEIKVSVKLVDDNGEIHNLTRTHKSNTTSISYDGYNIRQAGINELFGERDVFLSMFNPLYLVETMGTDGRCLLETMLPVVSHETVLDALSESLKTAMADEKLLSPETYLKNKRSLIKELETDIIYFQGQADLKESEVKEARASIGKLSEDIKAVEKRIAELEALCSGAENDTIEIAVKNAALKALYLEYAHLDELMSKVHQGYQCPTCLQEMSDDYLSSFKENMLIKLKECTTAGRRTKAQLASLKDKLALSESLLIELDGLRNKKNEMEAMLEIYQATLNKPDYKERITKAENEISKLKVLVNNALAYLGKRNELLFESLNMNRVKITLFEVVKSTGEVKDVFKFTYNGTEYKRLSLSEKIRAGLEVTELVKRLSGRNYPTFIDNSESICAIDNIRPTGQLIFSLVEKGSPLTVVIKGTTQKKAG